MSPEQFRRAAEVFEAAVEMDQEERQAYLERTLGDDGELREEVRSLLSAAGKSEQFLEEPALERSPPWGRIGPYRILRHLGRGGMGTVFLAERADGTFERQVALKVAHRVATGAMERRLCAERQILGSLEHPYIARLLDAGTTPDGLPYFVMEHVEGQTITRYCGERGLGLAPRLSLFRKVCAAVAYAHSHLVVHRDLKPAHILVSADGEPKLLDFGIAKLHGPDPDEDDQTTQGERPLTPSYASPEQLLGQPVHTASDVYSLGVVLYKLLTGRLPRELRQLEGLALEQVLDREPPAASAAQSADKDGAVAASLRIDRDLDTILAKALHREPERRYASVEQLAEDLRLYQEGRPVRARPDTLLYRWRKQLGRHKAMAAAAALFLFTVLAFSASSLRQAQRLEVERDRARTGEQASQATLDFLVSLLGDADPRRGEGPDVPLRDALERGTEQLQHRLGDQPAVRAELLGAIGSVYHGLGDYDRSLELFNASLADGADQFRPARKAAALFRLGILQRDRGELQDAEVTLEQSLALWGDEPSAGRAGSLNALGLTAYLTGQYGVAEEFHRRALDVALAVHGSDHPATANTRMHLARAVMETGDTSEAEDLLRSSLEIQERHLGSEHPDVAVLLNHIGYLARRQGRGEEAESLLRRALDIRLAVFGEDHMETGAARNNLAAALANNGKTEEATQNYLQCLQVVERRVGPMHRDVAVLHSNLGRLALESGDLEAADEHLGRSLAVMENAFPSNHPGKAYPMQFLADLRQRQGRVQEAETLLRQTLELRSQGLAPNHPESASTRVRLAQNLLVQGRQEDARPLLEEAHATLLEQLGAEHPQTLRAGELLTGLAEAPAAAGGGGSAQGAAERKIMLQMAALRAPKP